MSEPVEFLPTETPEPGFVVIGADGQAGPGQTGIVARFTEPAGDVRVIVIVARDLGVGELLVHASELWLTHPGLDGASLIVDLATLGLETGDYLVRFVRGPVVLAEGPFQYAT